MRTGKYAAAAAIALLAGMITVSNANAMSIVDYFGPSIQNDPNAFNIEQAVTQTTSSIARLYSNPVTVSILFQQAPVSKLLGQSQNTTYAWDTADYDYFSAQDYLAHPNNTPLLEGLLNLSTGNGYPTASNPLPNLSVTGADLRALGLNAPGTYDMNGNYLGTSGPIDSVITLTTSSPMDYNVNVPAYDGSNLTFNGRNVIAHEVDEALGIGGAGSNLNNVYFIQNGGTTGSAFWDNFYLTAVGPLDRFRYAAPGVASFTTDPNATAYFSLDGGVTNLATFNQNPKGDYGDLGPSIYPCGGIGYGGPPGEIQDAFGGCNVPTTQFSRGLPEDIMLQSIGWDPTPEPATWAMIILGLAMVASAVRRRGEASICLSNRTRNSAISG